VPLSHARSREVHFIHTMPPHPRAQVHQQLTSTWTGAPAARSTHTHLPHCGHDLPIPPCPDFRPPRQELPHRFPHIQGQRAHLQARGQQLVRVPICRRTGSNWSACPSAGAQAAIVQRAHLQAHRQQLVSVPIYRRTGSNWSACPSAGARAAMPVEGRNGKTTRAGIVGWSATFLPCRSTLNCSSTTTHKAAPQATSLRTLGLGMSPKGPSTLPARASAFMNEGVATCV